MVNSRHTLLAAACLGTAFLVSCDRTPDAGSRTDAMRQEIFHGQPKTLFSATYPAVSNAGEWFRDTTVTDVPQTSYTYNIGGGLTEEVHNRGSEWPLVTITYEYTAGSPRKAASIWMQDTTVTSRMTYRYDKDNRLINTGIALPDGTVDGKIDYELNRKGYPKETRYFDGHGVLYMREVDEYNRAGKMIGQDIYSYTKDNNRHKVIRYTYQGNGLKASSTTQDETQQPKETRTIYTYEYDAQGNWIRCVAYNETLKTAAITERRITYYE
ncbi:MAG: hypothetical protein LIO68_07705 [Rikenellaceae bacterium]|nr:hypothetical protein [Rikenellaceae bacterium]